MKFFVLCLFLHLVAIIHTPGFHTLHLHYILVTFVSQNFANHNKKETKRLFPDKLFQKKYNKLKSLINKIVPR